MGCDIMAKITVVCDDKAGQKVYDKIVQSALQDVVIGKSLIEVKMICMEKEPLFVIGALPKKTSKIIKLREVVTVEETKTNENGETITTLKITDETYGPELQEKLNIIEQPSRFEIITNSPIDLDMPVHDGKEDFKLKLLDFMNRVFPEGMRVRKIFYGDSIVMMASERPYDNKWIDIAMDLKEELEEKS